MSQKSIKKAVSTGVNNSTKLKGRVLNEFGNLLTQRVPWVPATKKDILGFLHNMSQGLHFIQVKKFTFAEPLLHTLARLQLRVPRMREHQRVKYSFLIVNESVWSCHVELFEVFHALLVIFATSKKILKLQKQEKLVLILQLTLLLQRSKAQLLHCITL